MSKVLEFKKNIKHGRPKPRILFPQIEPLTRQKSDIEQIKLQKTELTNLKTSLLIQSHYLQGRLKEFNKEKLKIAEFQAQTDKRTSFARSFRLINIAKTKKGHLKIKGINEYIERSKNDMKDIMKKTSVLEKRHLNLESVIKTLNNQRQFLNDTLSALPRDYIKTHKDQSIEGLIARYSSLLHTNKILVHSMEANEHKMKGLHTVVETLMRDQQLLTMNITSNIKKLNDQKDKLRDQVQRSELEFHAKHFSVREMVRRFGILVMSLDNVVNKCILTYKTYDLNEIVHSKSPLLMRMSVEKKIGTIEEYILQNSEVLMKMAETEPISRSIYRLIKNIKFK